MKNSEKLPPWNGRGIVSSVLPFCLALVPNCNDPSKFSDRQVYANSVDPDQTSVPSRFTMFAILSASLRLIMSKNDPDQKGWLQFFLYPNLRKIRGVPS